ncbi:MAG: hypothetical protein HN750_01265 [Gemmatimonadales bacterium]|jgi:hypothetical protein|nr:hypothetical protein [Gemmatimonadales bacterium]
MGRILFAGTVLFLVATFAIQAAVIGRQSERSQDVSEVTGAFRNAASMPINRLRAQDRSLDEAEQEIRRLREEFARLKELLRQREEGR